MDFENQNIGNSSDESIDDLIASAREELEHNDALINESDARDDSELPQTDVLPPLVGNEPQLPQEETFEPDFGNAFDDYGEYEDEAEPMPEPPRRRKKQHLKRMRFPTTVKVLIYLAIIVVIGVVAANVGWKMADDVLALTRPSEDVVIDIESSDTLDEISAKLKDAGAISYEWLFKLYCKFTKTENYFDPGVYTINLTYDYHALVNNLMASAGNRESVKIMIIEGADCADIFSLLEENGVCSTNDLEQCAAQYEFDYDFLRSQPYEESNRLEGYLFPDTYEFYLNDQPENVLEKLLDNFDRKLDDELMAAVDESEYSLHEIITIASIIEGEAANDDERGKVASVIYNRLNNWDNPLLNMDSTVYYAAAQEFTAFSLELDSPYNTYLYPGLPKGPINNPGINSIRAALYPEQTDYYYFATATDGHNRFFANADDFTAFINSDEFNPITTGE